MSMSTPAFPGAQEYPAFGAMPRSTPVSGRTDTPGFRFTTDWVYLVVPAMLIVLRIASPPTSALAYVVASAWALSGRRQAVLALFFCWLFNNTSHSFCGPPLYAAILRYAVLFSAALSVFARGPSRTSTTKVGVLFWVTLPLFVLILAHSIVVSRLVDISLLKVISFAVAFLTALCGWAWMSPKERERCFAIIVGTLVFVMFASVALLPTGRAYFKGTRLVKGFLQHSQLLGVTAAVTTSILVVENLVRKPFRWWRLVALFVSFAALYLSGARGGLLAVLGGVFVGGCWQAVMAVISTAKKRPRIVQSRLAWSAAGVALLFLFAGGTIYRAAVRFVLKYGDAESVSVTALEGSAQARISKVDDMFRNIRRHPVDGIGFGVASDFETFPFILRDPILGLPIMATVEKCVMPVMIIEELGVPLGILTLGWILVLGYFALRGGFLPLCVYATVVFNNLAEATFFSAGGAGLLLIILVCWAVTQPAGERGQNSAGISIGPGTLRGRPLAPIAG